MSFRSHPEFFGGNVLQRRGPATDRAFLRSGVEWTGFHAVPSVIPHPECSGLGGVLYCLTGDAERGGWFCHEPLGRDRITAVGAVAIGAVIKPTEGELDLVEEVAIIFRDPVIHGRAGNVSGPFFRVFQVPVSARAGCSPVVFPFRDDSHSFFKQATTDIGELRGVHGSQP